MNEENAQDITAIIDLAKTIHASNPHLEEPEVWLAMIVFHLDRLCTATACTGVEVSQLNMKL